jgi:dGTPase
LAAEAEVLARRKTVSLIDRAAAEEHEARFLAPYAALSRDSRGRRFIQAPHPLRTEFQRDRDRIIHSTAFRRMQYKTQVFLPHDGDHFRTRLTHTIEVAQIARTLARSLGLNEDLAEAVALAHDLGHTPFGHAGEDVLDRLLTEHGGFNHNRQSLRVVDILEQRYDLHPGLNLTYEVREGIAKHETSTVVATEEFHPEERPTLEAALVDLADEIAYNAADTDDGLNAGLITYDDLAEVSLFDAIGAPAEAAGIRDDHRRYATARHMVNRMARDVIEGTVDTLQRLGIETLSDVRLCGERIVTYSIPMKDMVSELKTFLGKRVYRHPRLEDLTVRSRETIEALYSVLREKPELMPERFLQMLGDTPAEIVVADYIAGMTDRFAEQLVRSLGRP